MDYGVLRWKVLRIWELIVLPFTRRCFASLLPSLCFCLFPFFCLLTPRKQDAPLPFPSPDDRYTRQSGSNDRSDAETFCFLTYSPDFFLKKEEGKNQ